jgi:hypothetical protein
MPHIRAASLTVGKSGNICVFEETMSRKPWPRDLLTGLPLSRTKYCEGEFFSEEGKLNTDQYPDCDIFNINSFASLAGFSDPAYFENVVLTDTSSIFHAHKERLKMSTASGTVVGIGTLWATHTNSAIRGGELWRDKKFDEARERMNALRAGMLSKTTK